MSIISKCVKVILPFLLASPTVISNSVPTLQSRSGQPTFSGYGKGHSSLGHFLNALASLTAKNAPMSQRECFPLETLCEECK